MQIIIGTPIQQIRSIDQPSGYTERLSVGDEVKGQVLSAGEGSAVIRTEGGAVLKAVLGEGTVLAAGDEITLSVQEKQGAQVVMKLMQNEGGDSSLAGLTMPRGLEAQLARLGIGADKLNIAQAFSELRLPVTLSNMDGAAALLEAFPSLSSEQAAFLSANSMVPNEALLGALKAWTENGDTVGAVLGRMSDVLMAFEEGEVPGEVTEKTMDANQGREANIPLKASADEGGVTMLKTAEGQEGQAPAALETLRRGAEPQARTSVVADLGVKPETVALLERHGVSDEALGLFNRLPNMSAGEASVEIARFMESLPENAALVVRQDIAGALLKAAAHDPAQEGSQPENVAGNAQQESAQIIENMSVPPGMRKEAGELLDVVKRLFAKLSERPEENAREVARAAKELIRGVDRLKERIAGSPLRDVAALAGQADSVQSQARLMDSINRFAYVQIPIDFDGRQRSADLYVMKRRGGRVIDPENVTMLVGLDTQAMGRLESVIKIEGRGVAVRFRADDEGVRNFLKAHSVQLHGAVSKAGYRLVDVKCSPLDEPVTPLNVEKLMDEIAVANSQLLDIVI